MASINKLSIRGVRSFSPDDAEQVLEFYFPCTIIVGANGCGKTTIIESLKFAVCGALPPGNKSGQAFVHDPRSIGQSTVKANVKVRFTNRAGTSMVVVRSMEVQQKKTTLTFKQLDGVLRTVDKHGNRQSLSHKCSELDRQIPLLLGVSKSILEHVVFCHQEDASWPLQEGAVLKKRFDDIFDSSRYSKALEVFAKEKKTYSAIVKDLKAELAGLSSHKHASKGFQQEVSNYNAQIEELEEEMTDSRSAITEMDADRDRLKGIMEQVEDLNHDLESKRNELFQQQAVVKKQRTMLQEDLTKQHTVRELQQMLRDFDTQIDKQVERQQELQDELSARQGELSRLRNEETELQSQLGRLQGEHESHEKRLQLRYEKMMEIGSSHDLGDVLTPISQTQPSETQNTNTSYMDSSMAANNTIALSQPILDIPEEDMREFYNALEKKEVELKEALVSNRNKRQQEEDKLQTILADLKGKLNSIENDRERLGKESSEARRELQSINSQVSTTSRHRKSDVEEAKRVAAKFSKERDEANADPRRTEIPTEIRSMEEKIDKYKREIEDDQIALRDLRHSAEAQNAIAVLREQCAKDLETLQERMQEETYAMQKNKISFPPELPGARGGDANGEELVTAFESMVVSVTSKHESANLELIKATADMNGIQRLVSEKSALLSYNQNMLAPKKARMNLLSGENGSIDKVRRVVKAVREYQQSIGITTPNLDESQPQELLSYLESRLQEEEAESTEGIQPQVIKKVITRLKKQSKTKFACPCCTRDMETEKEIQDFVDQMAILMGESSPLLKTDERNKAAKGYYKNWRKIVAENMNDILDYRRLVNEARELELNIAEIERILSDKSLELDQARSRSDELQLEVDELRELLESCKRWAEAAGRIAEKRMQVNQKKDDLSMSIADIGGRDLKTVEREVADRLEKKDNVSNQINRINKEMSSLNNRISSLSNQASRTEKMARDKEAMFARDQQLSEKKVILTAKIGACAEQEKKLQEEISPLRQKIRSKESEKHRLRTSSSEDEERLTSELNNFVADVRYLKELSKQVDEYTASDKKKDLSQISSKRDAIVEKMKAKEAEIRKMQPDVDRLNKAVADKENHKKNLAENIDLIHSGQRIDELDKEIAALEEEAGKVEGSENCDEDWERLAARKQELLSAQARLEGRRGEIMDSIRSLKRKLSTPEYKNVDEEHRVAMIKHETTQMAVRDIDKYYNALDQALLRFHSLKIAEINKIIRDLWCLTYKGEDITNIELVSGQEGASRASRSYNYRVVMTKGTTQMDMRGRCSAGQRVLASIVIRLALAETFCVNCGCIALDEPTVNLDHNNKRGLAIALAQIIASRAQQSNFQLILITHDEDFVAMMKTELSSQTGFVMPEKYFQVRREEGTDGKFYSKIDAIDWDELV